MNLRFIETFLWVARLGNFSAAAERLHTTQAGISNRIATLERDLGVRLFERDTRCVHLTATGRRALVKAEELVRVANDFRETVTDPECLQGTIRIGTMDTIVHAWLPAFIERFRERYPSIGIDLNTDTSLHLAEEVKDRRIDLALVMGPVSATGLTNLELCTLACAWVSSPKLRMPAHPITLVEIARHPVLAYSKGSIPHRRILSQLAEAGVEAPTIYNSNSLATIIRLAADGIGVAPLPVAIIREHLMSGALVVHAVAPPFPAMACHAVYSDNPDDRLAPIAARLAQEVAGDFVRAQYDSAW